MLSKSQGKHVTFKNFGYCHITITKTRRQTAKMSTNAQEFSLGRNSAPFLYAMFSITIKGGKALRNHTWPTLWNTHDNLVNLDIRIQFESNDRLSTFKPSTKSVIYAN